MTMRDFALEWQGWSIAGDAEHLTIARQGDLAARLGACPQGDEDSGRRWALAPWRQAGPQHFAADLNVGGSVHVAVEHGHICYWMETGRAQFDRLLYFPDSHLESCGWRTFVSDECDRFWDLDLDKTVPISSAYSDLYHPDGGDGAGMTDPGDNPLMWIFNTPPRALAFALRRGWLGLSIPGALPVGVTRPRMLDRTFSLSFEMCRPACWGGQGPRVYLATELADPYDVLDTHRQISQSMGLTMARGADHPDWWANPFYDYWDELCRWQKEHPELDQAGQLLTPERWRSWLETTKASVRCAAMNTNFEQYCYLCYGDYRPVPELGGTAAMRRRIDELRQAGTHVSWYLHPFLVNKKCLFYQQHPEAFCQPRDAAYRFQYALERGEENPEYALVDWTHPRGREHMLQWVDYLISDRPDCLNCDILRSNHWRSPDPRLYRFHDPDWGIGDLMTMKVQKALYERAKQVKPHCLVSKVGVAEPYMQPYLDVDYLCEEWTGSMEPWYRRSRIATRTMPDVLFITDAWFVTITKSYEYYMGFQCWQIPNTDTVNHAPHPYHPSWREFREKDHRRRRAGFQVYLNAPCTTADQCSVEVSPEGDIRQWRKYTRGPLAGWYAGLALSRRCLVTYNETQALVAASETRFARIPLPPAAGFLGVERVTHDGQVDPWPAAVKAGEGGPVVEMRVEDCGQEALYFRIRYQLQEGGHSAR